MSVATIEPAAITAGDTVTWSRSLAEYPATASWVLRYALRSDTQSIDIVASASGADHLVNVLPATTRAWVPGSYAWGAYATKGADRFEVGRGVMLIRADLAAVGPVDARTQAARAVDDLRAALATFKATSGRVRRYRIADREVEFESLGDLLKLLQYWTRELQAEQAAAGVAAGLPAKTKIQVRF